MISFLFNSATDRSVSKVNSEDGFPHSEICGSKFAHNSPQLIAACHVLHRLCMPRHPPIALTSRLRIHTTIDRPACMTGADIRWMVLLAYTDSTFVQTTQLDNHCCFVRSRTHRHPRFHANAALFETAPSRHRFLEPIYNVKDEALPPLPRVGPADLVSSSLENCAGGPAQRAI